MTDRLCSAPGCARPHLAKGLCGLHYTRMREHGGLERREVPSPRRVDLVGQRFGMLTVLEMEYLRGNDTKVRCICDCGRQRVAYAYNVRNGNTSSCGCMSAAAPTSEKDREALLRRRVEHIRNVGHRNRKHGHTGMIGPDGKRHHSKTYASWSDAKKRCLKPQNKRYPSYGGRGIRMCDAWRDSFAAFLADMGERPEGTTLDRIDVNGHYEPGNCRWATKVEQARNTRTNVATPETVAAIRAEFSAGATARALAETYGMSDSNVYMIVQRKTWKDAA